MDERRQRFLDYFERTWKPRGGRKAFMEATGFKKARVSQMFDLRQPFGEKAGQRIAEKLGLPLDYFEVRQGGFTRRAAELARMFDAAPDGREKDRWFASATVFLESMEAQEGTAAEPAPSTTPMREPAHNE